MSELVCSSAFDNEVSVEVSDNEVSVEVSDMIEC